MKLKSIKRERIKFFIACICAFIFLMSIKFNVNAANETIRSSINIVTFQPVYTEMVHNEDDNIDLPTGVPNDGECIPKAVEFLTNTFSNCNLYHSTRDIGISKEDIQKLGQNQIIIFQGHGTWLGEDIHSTILSGEDYSEEEYDSNPYYKEDCEKGRIEKDVYTEALTTKFIEEYCGDLSNSIIFLAICQGAYHMDDVDGDRALIDTFLNKGATAVIGYTQTTLMRYSNCLVYETISNLGRINPNTSTYYTLNEALQEAKEKYGQTDSERCPGLGVNSKALVFYKTGATDYSILSASNDLTINTELDYNAKIQFGVIPGEGYTLSGTYAALEPNNYVAYATLNAGHTWSDGSTDTKTINWKIKKATLNEEDVRVPVSIATPKYTGEALDLIYEKASGYGTYYYKLNGESSWHTDIPIGIYPGDYTVEWYFDGGSNANNIGSEISPISETVTITRGKRRNINILMNDYHYGGPLASPRLSITPPDNPEVKFYYNDISSPPPDYEWANMTSTTLPIGDYIIYAKIPESSLYEEYETLTETFKVLDPIKYRPPNTGIK